MNSKVTYLRQKDYLLNQYGELEILSNDELIDEVSKAKLGDKNSQETIIKSLLQLIYSIANKFYNPKLEFEDLIQVGIIGCIKAINTFDINRGRSFVTYAYTIISNEFRLQLRKCKQTLLSIEDEFNMTINSDGSLKLADTLIDYKTSYIDEDVEDSIMISCVMDEVENLPDVDRTIIELSFGLNNHPKKTQKEISEIVNLTQSYVSRKVVTICSRIRKAIE